MAPPSCCHAVLCPPCVCAVWWAVSTFFTMGAQDLGPRTMAEVIFGMVYISACVLLW